MEKQGRVIGLCDFPGEVVQAFLAGGANGADREHREGTGRQVQSCSCRDSLVRGCGAEKGNIGEVGNGKEVGGVRRTEDSLCLVEVTLGEQVDAVEALDPTGGQPHAVHEHDTCPMPAP